MDDNIAIYIKNISKAFKLPHEKQALVKGLFVNMLRGKQTYERQKVLSDISFQIKKGEFFGIVGRNGSGKSTLLKLIAGIYTPDKGQIQINGTFTPFIELGVGFNPELTGRENIFLNGALLGFSRKEMETLYQDIIEFAELEQFMDQKLKNYSSGMQVRLAFSIAIRVNSGILVLDEVLAVGDEAFQQKCLDVFEEYKASDKTIVLVTHDMSVVERFCSKAVLLHEGGVILQGDPRKVARTYSKMNRDSYLVSQSGERERDIKVNVQGFNYRIIGSKGRGRTVFDYDEVVTLKLSWKNTAIKNIGVALVKLSGEYIYGANTILSKYDIKSKSLSYNLRLNVGPGKYHFIVGLFGQTERDALDFIDNLQPIIVLKSKNPTWDGVTRLQHEWSE